MTTPAPSSALTELARSHGVATEYWDWQGNNVIVAESTLVAVLAALDVDASTEDAAERSLAAVQDRAWLRPLPPVVGCREGWTPWVPVHLPDGDVAEMWVIQEDGVRREVGQVDRWVEPREIDGVLTGEATFEVPGDLPLGWHTLHARLPGRTVTAPLAVTPAKLTSEKLLPPQLASATASRTCLASSSSGICTVEPVARSVSSAAPAARPRLPTVTRNGMPTSSASLNLTPARTGRSSTMTSTPASRSAW